MEKGKRNLPRTRLELQKRKIMIMKKAKIMQKKRNLLLSIPVYIAKHTNLSAPFSLISTYGLWLRPHFNKKYKN